MSWEIWMTSLSAYPMTTIAFTVIVLFEIVYALICVIPRAGTNIGERAAEFSRMTFYVYSIGFIAAYFSMRLTPQHEYSWEFIRWGLIGSLALIFFHLFYGHIGGTMREDDLKREQEG